MAEKSSIFREKALERLSSPESLDQLMRIAPARDWIVLGALGLLTLTAVIWSFVGQLPTTISARGILIRPQAVLDCQTVAAGRLESLSIHPGDTIRKGDVIGKIDQSEIRQQLEDDRRSLDVLQTQDRAKSSLQKEQAGYQTREREEERKFISMQHDSLSTSLTDVQAFAPTLKRRMDSLTELQKAGLIPAVSSDLVQAQQSYMDNEGRITDLKARLQQLEGQSKQLDTQQLTTSRDNFESSTTRKNQIQDLLSRIALNGEELQKNTTIYSEYSGRVVEILAVAGKVLVVGDRIARVEVEKNDGDLVNISYFSIGDGKKIKPGMPVQVTPDNVERQRYGGIAGTVVSVSNLPVTRDAAAVVLGNSELVQGLMPAGPYIEVVSSLQRDPSTVSGYKWAASNGPPIPMSGGLTGTVRATIEERAPISYVLPFLRSVSGIY